MILYLKRRFLSLVWRLRCRLDPEQTASFRLEDGSRFDYPLKSIVGWCLFTGRFEVPELKFLRERVRPGSTFLDVGANGGLYTVLASGLVGERGRVFSFEPGAEQLRLLERNVELNGLRNVTIVRSAVGDRRGEVQLGVSRDGAMSSLARTDHPAQDIVGWQPVEMITLDEFAREAGLDRVDFLKVDVEGAEKLVFGGARGLLAENPSLVVMFEAADVNAGAFGYSARELLTGLEASGFRVCRLDDEGQPLPVDASDPRIGTEVYNFVALGPGAKPALGRSAAPRSVSASRA
ncbi:MAG: FkbM family methyltransferase [Gemmatimonadota bacterium]